MVFCSSKFDVDDFTDLAGFGKQLLKYVEFHHNMV